MPSPIPAVLLVAPTDSPFIPKGATLPHGPRRYLMFQGVGVPLRFALTISLGFGHTDHGIEIANAPSLGGLRWRKLKPGKPRPSAEAVPTWFALEGDIRLSGKIVAMVEPVRDGIVRLHFATTEGLSWLIPGTQIVVCRNGHPSGISSSRPPEVCTHRECWLSFDWLPLPLKEEPATT